MDTAVTARLVLFILSLTVNVNSQTCAGTSQYGQCSSNNGCRCLHLSFTDDVGICALIGVSCSRLSPCESPNDNCQQPDHICVRHTQCHSQPLCYPLSMVDQRLCPPVVTVATSTSTTGFPWMTTAGPGRPMTTNGYQWSTSTTGFPWMTTASSTNIISTYSSALTTDSKRYFRNGNHYYSNSTDASFTDGNSSYTNSTGASFTAENLTGNHYYQAIQVIVNRTGHYTFKSSSRMDTYGYLYQSEFDPSNPSRNLIQQDDDSAGERQFAFSNLLQAGVPYTLVFTTFGQSETGPFSVIATGPATVDFTLNDIRQTTMMTNTVPTFNNSRYAGALTMNSSNYSRGGNTSSNFYYQAIEVIVNKSGNYTITSKSTIDTYGYIYQGSFYPSYPTFNVLAQDDDSGGNSQFRLTASLRADIKYILVVTTYTEKVTGPFSIEASGPDDLRFIST